MMPENSKILDTRVPITADDKVAIQRMVFGYRGLPGKRSAAGWILTLSVWLGMAYLAKLWTDNWWTFGIALGFFAVIAVYRFRKQRLLTVQLNAMLRVGEIRLVEGIVQDYGLDDLAPRERKAKFLRKFFILLGDQRFTVEAAQMEKLRYGATVQLRFETTKGICIGQSVIAYGDHDLDWLGPVEPVSDTEEPLSLDEVQLIQTGLRRHRRLTIAMYLTFTGFTAAALLVDYLLFGWRWWQVLLGIFLVGFLALIRWARMPSLKRFSLPENAKKRVLEGVIVSHEVEIGAKTQHFWVLGTERVPLLSFHALCAEAGDRVRLYLWTHQDLKSKAKTPFPFYMERIIKRPVG